MVDFWEEDARAVNGMWRWLIEPRYGDGAWMRRDIESWLRIPFVWASEHPFHLAQKKGERQWEPRPERNSAR